MQLLCQIMQYIGTGPSNKICGRPDGTRCSRQACGIAVAFLSNPLHVSIHSHSTLLSEDAIRSTHCRDFHHRSIRRAREEQRRGDSINDVHIILGFFDSLFPLCPKNFYCVSSKLFGPLPPGSPLLCRRHIWKPQEAADGDAKAARKNTRSHRSEQNWPFERTERCGGGRRRKRKRKRKTRSGRKEGRMDGRPDADAAADADATMGHEGRTVILFPTSNLQLRLESHREFS